MPPSSLPTHSQPRCLGRNQDGGAIVGGQEIPFNNEREVRVTDRDRRWASHILRNQVRFKSRIQRWISRCRQAHWPQQNGSFFCLLRGRLIGRTPAFGVELNR